jgi:hypothetical protein
VCHVLGEERADAAEPPQPEHAEEVVRPGLRRQDPAGQLRGHGGGDVEREPRGGVPPRDPPRVVLQQVRPAVRVRHEEGERDVRGEGGVDGVVGGGERAGGALHEPKLEGGHPRGVHHQGHQQVLPRLVPRVVGGHDEAPQAEATRAPRAAAAPWHAPRR